MPKYSETDIEICNSKEVYTSWKKARLVLNNMRSRFIDRKAKIVVYKCKVDSSHYHIGSVSIKAKPLKLEDYYENYED